jgi:hypothetical protein
MSVLRSGAQTSKPLHPTHSTSLSPGGGLALQPCIHINALLNAFSVGEISVSVLATYSFHSFIPDQAAAGSPYTQKP